MTVRFLAVARQELDDAFVWYERQSSGLGYEFLDEIDRTIHRIKAYPDSCAELTPGMRRALVNRSLRSGLRSRCQCGRCRGSGSPAPQAALLDEPN